MREILFRGRQKDNGEWVEGFYSQFHNRPTINEPNSHQIFELIDEGVKLFGTSIGGFWHIVDPETVGQYTGLTDKNGTKIFEGDIVKGIFYGFPLPIENFVFTIGWQEDVAGYRANYFEDVEIIGNIHDNPELIGG